MRDLERQCKFIKKSNPVMLHGSMNYRCENCGEEWTMWLEMGVEDQGIYGRVSQPCPFTILCDCGGLAQHIEWHQDVNLPVLKQAEAGMRYFAYDNTGRARACGIPCIFRK